MAEEQSKKNTATRIIAIVGFVAILVIGIWGAINAVRLSPQLFSTLASPFGSGNGDTSAIDITAPEGPLTSGEPITITWEHGASDQGVYAFSYRCREGFRFEAVTADGSNTPIICETPYSIGTAATATRELRVVPVSENEEQIEVPFVIVYASEDGEDEAEGSATLAVAAGEPGTIAGSGADDTDTTDTNTSGTTQQPQRPAVADLSIRVLDVGLINPQTGFYQQHPHGNVPYSNYGENFLAAARFAVTNTGGAASGTWHFNADLPTTPPYSYTSPTQNSLNPGDRIEFTLRFDQLVRGQRMFTIHVDPNQEVREIREDNNIARQLIVIQ